MKAWGVIAAAAVLIAGSACAPAGPGAGDGGPVTLTFQSLAFQEPTVAATERIVADWNDTHPDVQVQLTQGDFDTVHDELVTRFRSGTAPDVIHDESADIAGFAREGYLADLGPLLSAETTDAVPDALWDSVTVDGVRVAAPTLLQSYVVYANTALLEHAGVTLPTGASWSWDELADAARQATTPRSAGLGWGLQQPTATVMSLGPNFGATFFTDSGDDTEITIGDAELEVPRRIHEMAYGDRSLDPMSLGQTGSEVVTGFLEGRYAMVVGGSFIARQLTEAAPDGFAWTVLPALSGTSAAHAANPQTLSVPADCPHPAEAAAFIDFVMQPENLADLAEGDWLVPTTDAARDAVAAATGGADGWAATLAGADSLTTAPFHAVSDYPRWKDEVATPALTRYLADEIDLATLRAELTDGWASIS